MRPTFCLLAAAALALGGCGGDTTDRLLLTGSSTIAPLAAEIAARYEARHPGTRVDVETGGSSRGIRDAGSGAADVGMTSRALHPEEEAGLVQTVLAHDGVAFVVHADNPLAELTDDQLRAVYTGRVSDWSELGGAPGPVVVVSRAQGRSELDLVTEYLGIEASQIDADVIDGETQQNLKTVVGNPLAITYTSVGAAELAAASGQPLKVLPLGGVRASAATVRSGAFPLARPLILLRRDADGDGVADPHPAAEAFVAYATGPGVADLAVGLGYVPLQDAPEEQPPPEEAR